MHRANMGILTLHFVPRGTVADILINIGLGHLAWDMIWAPGPMGAGPGPGGARGGP